MCHECAEHNLALLDEKLQEIEVLHKQNTSNLMKIKRLKREGDQRLRSHAKYKEALDVLEFWAMTLHPGAREIEGGERLKNVIDRLSGKGGKPYTVSDLKECVRGYEAYPYVVNSRRVKNGSPAERRIDAELIFADPKRVDQGRAFYAEILQRKEVIPVTTRISSQEALGPMGQTALAMATTSNKWRGWHVFPIAPRAKLPVTANGLKDATQDLDRIRAFWMRHPEHNIGVRCGIESGIVVLDVDERHGGGDSLAELEKEHGKLPKTLSVVTPSGGQHYYFRHPGQGEIHNTAGYPKPGLDIRGDGGYVLGPGSIGANGKRYEVDERLPAADMPLWLIHLLVNFQKHIKGLNLEEWTALVTRNIAQGERNNTMAQIVGKYWTKLNPQSEQEIGFLFGTVNSVNRANFKPPMSDKEVAAVVQSIARRESRKGAQLVLEAS